MTLAFEQLPCTDSPLSRLDPRWKLAALLVAVAGSAVLRSLPAAAVALAGALLLAWLGLFFGLVTVFFSVSASPTFLVGAVLLGAAFGMLFGLASYAATRRRRDFSSVMQVTATSYSLVIDPETANRARNVLGLAIGSPVATAVQPTELPPAGPTGPAA